MCLTFDFYLSFITNTPSWFRSNLNTLFFAGHCAYLDAENAIDPSLLDAMGINIDKLLFARSDHAENTLSVVNTLASSGAVDVIVVDSVRIVSHIDVCYIPKYFHCSNLKFVCLLIDFYIFSKTR